MHKLNIVIIPDRNDFLLPFNCTDEFSHLYIKIIIRNNYLLTSGCCTFHYICGLILSLHFFVSITVKCCLDRFYRLLPYLIVLVIFCHSPLICSPQPPINFCLAVLFLRQKCSASRADTHGSFSDASFSSRLAGVKPPCHWFYSDQGQILNAPIYSWKQESKWWKLLGAAHDQIQD